MSTTTNSVELVLHKATEPIPVFHRDEIQPLPPPPPAASEEENRSEINHQEHEQGSTHSRVWLQQSLRTGGFIEHIKEKRSMLLIVATLFLQMSYQAALNPPGGFWQDDPSTATVSSSSFAPAPLGGGENGGHRLPYQAGDPIMRTKNYSQYLLFEILNSVALGCSMVLITILLLTLSLENHGPMLSHVGLMVANNIMFVDQLSILFAYYIVAINPENPIKSLIPYFALAAATTLHTVYLLSCGSCLNLFAHLYMQQGGKLTKAAN